LFRAGRRRLSVIALEKSYCLYTLKSRCAQADRGLKTFSAGQGKKEKKEKRKKEEGKKAR